MGRMHGIIVIATASAASGMVLLFIMADLAGDTADAMGSIHQAGLGPRASLIHDGDPLPVADLRLTTNGFDIPHDLLEAHLGPTWDPGEELCVVGCFVRGESIVELHIRDGVLVARMAPGDPLTPIARLEPQT